MTLRLTPLTIVDELVKHLPTSAVTDDMGECRQCKTMTISRSYLFCDACLRELAGHTTEALKTVMLLEAKPVLNEGVTFSIEEMLKYLPDRPLAETKGTCNRCEVETASKDHRLCEKCLWNLVNSFRQCIRILTENKP